LSSVPPSLNEIEVRFLTIASQMPGAVIVAAGQGAQDWAASAQPLTPVCRVVALADDPACFAQALSAAAIGHIFLLRLAGEGVAQILNEANRLLAYSRIDALHFSDLDVRSDLPAIAAKLAPHDYRLFGVEPDGERMTELRSWIEGMRYERFMAVNRRIVGLLLQNDHAGLDLAGLCGRHGIKVVGLIHLGAHEGQELAGYRKIGDFPVVFVEAHPDIYKRLEARIGSEPEVLAIHAAVSDREGAVTLHVSSDDQSSSVLPLSGIERLIPTTAESGTIEVPGRTLDSLFAELRANGHAAARANLLVSDIQGAELMALRGAESTLAQFDAIMLELSFDELYAGCAQVEEIDQFLGERGFIRVATVSAWHPSWSDALYVRR
jgi:FkbM family methyltransferase